MVFRTVSAIAALMIWLGASGGKALAQYYPPVQAYPPQGYYPRQGYRAPVVDDDDDMVYDLEGRPLPPGTLAKPQANKTPGGRYDYRDLSPPDGEDYEPYFGVPGGIPPGPADSAEQDAIRREAMRSRMPITPGRVDPGRDDPPVTRSIGGRGDPRDLA